jgi:hypothetical protein
MVTLGSAKAQVGFKEIGATSGTVARIIHAAMPSFVGTGLDIAEYRVEVWEMGSSYVVAFSDASFERPFGHWGGSPNRPEFEVTLERSTLRIIRANFVR